MVHAISPAAVYNSALGNFNSVEDMTGAMYDHGLSRVTYGVNDLFVGSACGCVRKFSHLTDLDNLERRGYFSAIDRYPYAEIHFVGGNPPALDSPLLRDDHLFYTTSQSTCAKVAEGKPPASGSPLCSEDHAPYITCQGWMGACRFLQELLAYSSQVVSGKASLVSKEAVVGRIVGVELIPQGGKFDAADVVGYLKEMIVVWPGISIDCGMLGEAVSNCLMDGMLDNLLPVVVVDLHAVKFLEVFELGANEFLEFSLDAFGKFIHAWKPALLVAQDMVVVGSSFGEDAEMSEMALSGFERHRLILIMASRDRRKMEWYSVEPRIREAAHVFLDTSANILILVVEHKGNEIEGGAVADIARFVYEDRELLHQAVPFETI